MELKTTRHFKEQWRRYFKEKPPNSYLLLRIINQSIWLQRSRLLFEADGTQYKLLATYWHPKRNLVLKVDWLENEVVTVITEKSKTPKASAVSGRFEVGGRRFEGKDRRRRG